MSFVDLPDLWKRSKKSFAVLDQALMKDRDSWPDLTINERKVMSESIIELKELSDRYGEKLPAPETESLRLRFEDALSLSLKELTSKILVLYYYASNLKNRPHTTPDSTISILLEIRAVFSIGPEQVTTQSTVWQYFKRDISSFAEQVKNAIEISDRRSFGHHLFVLLNLIHTLSCLSRCHEKFEDKELGKWANFAPRHLRETIDFLNGMRDDQRLRASISSSPGVVIYLDNLSTEGVFDQPGSELDAGFLRSLKSKISKTDFTRVDAKASCYHILGVLKDIGPNKATIRRFDSIRPQAFRMCPHLAFIVDAHLRFADGDNRLGLLPLIRDVDPDRILRVLFPDLDEVYETGVTQEELEKVLEMKGTEIKGKLFKLFRNHPAVSESEWTSLRYEAQKPDAAAEISDFDLPLDFQNRKIYVSFPIKSRRETRDSAKVEERFLYQFIRPFCRFPGLNVCVLPILIATPTLNLGEQLKIVRERLDLPLAIIDTDLFAKVLKCNKLL